MPPTSKLRIASERLVKKMSWETVFVQQMRSEIGARVSYSFCPGQIPVTLLRGPSNIKLTGLQQTFSAGTRMIPLTVYVTPL